MKIVNVILSGGVGSRLWPLSRKSQPKQYLPIFNSQTLFQKTAIRNKDYCEEVLIVGNCDNYLLSRKDLDGAGFSGYDEIIEACPRNTAAAIAFAAFARDPEDVLFVTPSDHLIQDGELYSKSVKRAVELASQGAIVTFGLRPTKAETGFGYIEAEGEDVKAFHEKPDKATAEKFVAAERFFWNSGMFCFKANTYLEELKKYEPAVYEASEKAFLEAKAGMLDYDLSQEIPSISVDYAVMERTDKIKVVASDFGWSDMGSFESIYEYLSESGHKVDAAGNMVIGTDIYTEFLGVQNTILIYSKDAILVLQKDKAQDVKKIYSALEEANSELIQ